MACDHYRDKRENLNDIILLMAFFEIDFIVDIVNSRHMLKKVINRIDGLYCCKIRYFLYKNILIGIVILF